MIGIGFLKRAARMKARSWVLSPISASATSPVEMKKASNVAVLGWNKTDEQATPLTVRQRDQRSRQAGSRLRQDLTVKSVDQAPPPQRHTPPCPTSLASGTAVPSHLRSTEKDSDRASAFEIGDPIRVRVRKPHSSGIYAGLGENSLSEPHRQDKVASDGKVRYFEMGFRADALRLCSTAKRPFLLVRQ
jgi:hypothetical protein